jgi:hypothetical protein
VVAAPSGGCAFSDASTFFRIDGDDGHSVRDGGDPLYAPSGHGPPQPHQSPPHRRAVPTPSGARHHRAPKRPPTSSPRCRASPRRSTTACSSSTQLWASRTAAARGRYRCGRMPLMTTASADDDGEGALRRRGLSSFSMQGNDR